MRRTAGRGSVAYRGFGSVSGGGPHPAAAPPLGLPDAVRQLALTSHYGQPMLGIWDPVGIVVSLALAVGGVGIGAWGFARRDLRG